MSEQAKNPNEPNESNELSVPTYRVGVEGNQSSPVGEGYLVYSTDENYNPPYWVSHRMGPFMLHRNDGTCTPQPFDNHSYGKNREFLIDQGFMPCPKCNP